MQVHRGEAQPDHGERHCQAFPQAGRRVRAEPLDPLERGLQLRQSGARASS